MSIDVQTSVPLARHTTLRVGGPAEEFVTVRALCDVPEALRPPIEEGTPLLLLGGGSNLLISDEGIPCRVVAFQMQEIVLRDDDPTYVGMIGDAGLAWDELVENSVEMGLWGLECLSGIPGTVGAAPVQNIGAYGASLSDVLHSVDVYDMWEGTALRLSRAECRFGYRTSRFRGADEGRFAILRVALRLGRSPVAPKYPELLEELRRGGIAPTHPAVVRDAVLALRRRKGMLLDAGDPDTRSAGSFFVNPIVALSEAERISSLFPSLSMPAWDVEPSARKLSAAWLIERAGFRRGFALGRAAISSKHALAIRTAEGCTAWEVVRLAALIRVIVRDRTGVTLTPEPLFAGFRGQPGELLDEVGQDPALRAAAP